MLKTVYSTPPKLKMGLMFGLLLIGTLIQKEQPMAFTPIWPSVCALLLVFVARSALMGLTGGALLGAVLLSENTWTAPVVAVDRLLLPALQSRWNLYVLLFTLVMGGFAAMLEFGGGLRSWLTRRLQTGHLDRRQMEGATMGLGLVCFFDGLANSMLVGGTMKPMVQTTGGSKLRLAYIVDSTSSPIACLAFLSTWIAYQLSMIREGLLQAGVEGNPYSLFLQSIPLNFYCWFTLLLLGLSILRQWNIGPMKSAIPENPEPLNPSQSVQESEPSSIPAYTAWIPLLTLAVVLPLGLYLSGTHAADGVGSFVERMAKADTALILFMTGCAACTAAALVYPASASVRAGQALVTGMERMLVPVLILAAAWALSTSLKELGAAEAVSAWVSEGISPLLLPAVTFLCGAAISFMTGTSWGTMGILMPLSVPLAVSGGQIDTSLMGMMIAAVFSGAVFGDHCSPISDTTIVSSISCGVEPFDHVRTQLPFALLSGGSALILGFVLCQATGWPWLSFALTALFFIVLTRRKSA